MPFLSKAQRRWMFKNKPEMAAEWAKETPKNKKLPEHVKKHKKQYGGDIRGIFDTGGEVTPVPIGARSTNTDYDTIPSYFNYIKSIQNKNPEGAQQVLNHVRQVRGVDMATDLSFLGKNLETSSINDIARRGMNTTNPQLKLLYAAINENPDIVNSLQYGTEMFRGQPNIASRDLGGQTKFAQGGLWDTNRKGFVDSTLQANKHLDFVDRLYNGTQSIQVPGEPYRSTHLMSYDPQSRRVFPEVVNKNGNLQYLGRGDAPYDYADKTGEYIQFKTAEQAKWFADSQDNKSGYKMGTGVLNAIEKGKPMNKRALGGGMTASEAYKSIFDDDDNKSYIGAVKENTAPTEEEVETQIAPPEQDQADMFASMRNGDEPEQRRFAVENYGSSYNPYKQAKVAFQSAGKYGTQNISPIGEQIASELSQDLGYAPKFNSIYRDPAQQAALVKQGLGVKNSYHLTGSAVDMNPSDWKNLSEAQQKKYRSKYDVISHNNHIHLEPKG